MGDLKLLAVNSMPHQKPEKRAFKGVGKHSTKKMGIKVDQPRKQGKKDKMILDGVISSVNSMQLSKKKGRPKYGEVEPLEAQLETKDKMILDGNTGSELGGPSETDLDIDNSERERYKISLHDGVENTPDHHIWLLQKVVGRHASQLLIHSYRICSGFSANLLEEEARRLAGLNDIRSVVRPYPVYFD